MEEGEGFLEEVEHAHSLTIDLLIKGVGRVVHFVALVEFRNHWSILLPDLSNIAAGSKSKSCDCSARHFAQVAFCCPSGSLSIESNISQPHSKQFTFETST